MHPPDVEIRPIVAEATRGLRHEVLRPHEAPATIVYDHEEDPATLHLGAFAGDVLVGTGTIHPDGAGVFRIRGMAVRDGRRGGGIGAAILDGLVVHARSRDAALIWCNARIPARAFYARAGFAAVGEEWDDPQLGPHVRMELRLG
ncbi:MAG: GNAT family N-acetyltransferase [Actinomycetota bacterium]